MDRWVIYVVTELYVDIRYSDYVREHTIITPSGDLRRMWEYPILRSTHYDVDDYFSIIQRRGRTSVLLREIKTG